MKSACPKLKFAVLTHFAFAELTEARRLRIMVSTYSGVNTAIKMRESLYIFAEGTTQEQLQKVLHTV